MIESSPLQRRMAFGLIVFVLVGLGIYLLGPAARGAGSPSSRPAQSSPAATVNPSSPAVSSSPASTATPSPTGVPDIYQWLPFTKSGLAAAAMVALRFGDAYGTFSYTEDAAGYIASLQDLVSPQLAAQIKAAYSTPGVAQMRISQKQISAGTAVIESLRAFGQGSLTFVVQVTEQLTQTGGPRQLTPQFAVTVTNGGTSWQVSDVELAAAGNS